MVASLQGNAVFLMKDPFLARRSEAAELFLIRHADAIPEADEIIPSGVYDDLPLSKKGRGQARALTGRLKGLSFDAVYSSPLRRCRETAAPLIEHLGLTPIIVEEIREIRLGRVFPIPTVKEGDNLEVLTQALAARQADIVRIAGSAGNWDSIKDSEPSKAFRKRVVDAIDKIVQNHIGQRVLIFAHGGVINAYAAEALGLNKDFFFPCANTSITVVRANSEARVLFVLNDIAHLSLLQSKEG